MRAQEETVMHKVVVPATILATTPALAEPGVTTISGNVRSESGTNFPFIPEDWLFVGSDRLALFAKPEGRHLTSWNDTSIVGFSRHVLPVPRGVTAFHSRG
jgi:hypothetical protein